MPEYLNIVEKYKETPANRKLLLECIELMKPILESKIEILDFFKYGQEINEKAREIIANIEWSTYPSIINQEFFNAIQIKFFLIDKRKANKCAALLLETIEDLKDIKEIEKFLPPDYHKSFKDKLAYYVWYKGLLKIVKNYQLEKPHKALIHKFKKSSSINNRIECMKALRKYKYNHTKEIFIDLYQNAKQKKVIDLAHEILEENNYFNNKNLDQLLLSEKDNVVYKKSLEVNNEYLKKKALNNNVVNNCLIEMVVQALKKEMKISYIKLNDSLLINISSSDREKNNENKKLVLSTLDFAFSDLFLNQEMYKKMIRININDINNESKQITKELEEKLSKFNLKEKLNKEIINNKKTKKMKV